MANEGPSGRRHLHLGHDRAHRFSEDIQAGTMWINSYDLSNLITPFGGFKQLGFDRDRSLHAIDKYVDLKMVWQSFR